MTAPRLSRRHVVGAGLTLSGAAGGGIAGCTWASGSPRVAERGLAAAPALKPPITYVALGASDAAGVGVEDPQRDGWVAVLGRSLPQPTRVVNLGIPGIKLAEALQVELPPAVDSAPDLVTVWMVVNDVLGGVPLDEYRAALRRLLRELRVRTRAKVAVGNLPDAPEQSTYLGVPPDTRPALTASWNETIAAAVAEYGAVLVNVFKHWDVANHAEYIGPDGLHPTATGYRALAGVFLQTLREHRIV
jgi:acyl-CoA thioesterase-1